MKYIFLNNRQDYYAVIKIVNLFSEVIYLTRKIVKPNRGYWLYQVQLMTIRCIAYDRIIYFANILRQTNEKKNTTRYISYNRDHYDLFIGLYI